MEIKSNPDLEIPSDLTDQGKDVVKAILNFMRKKDLGFTGGCKAFYSPKEWEDRGEIYGASSELVICHDGGDLAHIFNLDYENYDLYEGMREELAKYDVFVEQCTSWYSAVYKVE